MPYIIPLIKAQASSLMLQIYFLFFQLDGHIQDLVNMMKASSYIFPKRPNISQIQGQIKRPTLRKTHVVKC